MRKLRLAVLALVVSAAAHASRITVTLLATTDLHGNIDPIDYYTDRPAARGLAKIATLIAGVRRESANTLLIDCGGTIQGTPLESLYQQFVSAGRLPLGLRAPGRPLAHDPMMLAMNQLGYRAMVVGNHEFNFGLKNLDRARADARFPWISANIAAEPGAHVKPFPPYVVETVGGVKIAIIGITTPAIPEFEEPAHYRGYAFADGVQAVRSALEEVRRSEKPDLVIVAAHAGLGRDPSTIRAGEGFRSENMVLQIAREIPGLDAIVYGHSHQQMAGEEVNGELLVQPKNWGMSLGRIDFVLESRPDGRWKLVSKSSRLIPVKPETPAAPAMIEIARPYHELTERYLDTPVASSPIDMDGRFGRIEDSPLVDAIQAVERYYAKADVSFTALFNPRVSVRKGPVTVRQIAALYIYENDLYAIEGTGGMVKDALENAASYFLSCPDAACSHGPLTGRRVPGFNYDMASGVEYEIDLTQPEGRRIVNLRRNGRPLAPDEKLRIAINSYRAGGSGGYRMFRGAKVVWKSPEDLRSLIVRYYSQHGKLPSRAQNNWRIVPAEARKILEAEAGQ